MRWTHMTRLVFSTDIARVSSLGRKGLSTSMTRLTSAASSEDGKGIVRSLVPAVESVCAGGQSGALG